MKKLNNGFIVGLLFTLVILMAVLVSPIVISQTSRGCSPCNPWYMPTGAGGGWKLKRAGGSGNLDFVLENTVGLRFDDDGGNILFNFRDDGTTGTFLTHDISQTGSGTPTMNWENYKTITDGNSFLFKDVSGNTIMEFQDFGTGGRLRNDNYRLTVDAGTFVWSDPSNNSLMSLNDAGTTGGLSVTGTFALGSSAATLNGIQICTSTTNVASVAANSCLLTSLASVTGCTTDSNSYPLIALPSQPINGVMCIPNNSAGTMQIYCCNSTTGALDPPSTTFKVMVVKN